MQTLSNNTDVKLYYSTLSQKNCYQSNILKRLSEFKINLKAINGLNYELTIQSYILWQSIVLEILIYLSLKIDYKDGVIIYEKLRNDNPDKRLRIISKVGKQN